MRTLPVLLPLLLLTACLRSDASSPADPGVATGTGVVTGPDGAPLPGVLVTAKDTLRGVSVTVVTGPDGRYRFPPLADGAYRLRAFRPGFAPVQHPYDPAGEPVALSLAPAADAFDQAPSSAFVALLPDGEEKRKFLLDCAGCHQFDKRIVSFQGRLKSREQWVERIRQMLSFAGADTGFPIMSPSRDAERTADWLVAHVGGPEDPLPAFAPPPPMTGDDARVVVTEYDVPARHDLPHDLMPGPDGRVVVTGMMTAQMYRLDPQTGVFETIPIPVAYAGPRALDLGPDGAWWVLLGNPRQIARYDPAAQAWQTFDVGMYPHDIRRDDAGRLWFNGHFTKEPELIGYLDPATGQTETYEVPAPPMPDGGSTIPYGMVFDADGTLWATQLVGNRLLKFVPETERFTLYELPTPYSGPRRPDVGPDGAVWIPQFTANRIARFDPVAETFEEYELPIPDALPYIVRVDPRTGVVWVATAAADAVLRFDPATRTFAVHRLPTQKALIRHMELDADGAAWVAYGNSPAVDPKVARIEVVGGEGASAR